MDESAARELRRALRRGLPAAVLVMFAITAGIVFPGHHQIDLHVYRAGGEAALHGRPLYDPSFAAGLSPPLDFTYPAFAAVVMVPLALLPSWLVDVGWLLSEVAIVALLVTYAFRPLLERVATTRGITQAVRLRLLLCAGLVWISPVNDHLGFGQIDLLLLALVAVDLLGPATGLPRGVLVGIAAAIKLIPLVFVAYLFVTGRRRAAATALASAIACTAVSFAVLPHAAARYWTRSLFDTGRIGDTSYFSNQSLRGMIARTFGEGGPATGLWLLAALVVGVLGLAQARRVSQAGQEPTAVLLVALVGIAVSPISWIHHLVWLLLAVGLLLGDASDRRRVVYACLLTAVLWARLPYLGDILRSHGAPLPVTEPFRDAYGLLCLALLGWLPRATRAAKTPAPYPLSMLTTATPGAQEESMVASAAKPPAATP